MTAATTIERTGPAIRATLAEFAPEECAEFEVEFRQALTKAEADFDLRPVDSLLDRWWGIAVIRANPLTNEEQAQIARAKAGDFTGLLTRSEQGDWVEH